MSQSYGYSDGDAFQQTMKGGGHNILCMEQTYGIAGCPRCAEARKLYAAADNAGESREKPGQNRTAAKIQYHKKIYWCYGIVDLMGKPQNKQLCLINIPTQQVEEILKNVMHKNPQVRWDDPAALETGRQLAIDKFEKNDGSGYAQYSTKLVHTVYPLTADWWNGVRATLPSLDNPSAIQIALDTWPAANLFSPYSDMQKGETVMIRLLPHNVRPGATPFIVMKVHFSSTTNSWEKAWKNVAYDPARVAEVFADPAVAAGIQKEEMQQTPFYTMGYAGTPAGGVTMPNTVPGAAGGVTMPGLPNMDNLPQGY
jgi:hypothetical protein